ncbi:hypothetical protein [Sinorhizobium medicae]|uniref:hypothetical protein n=1 Tax=Sinorhizobium medicae TaxID=110321 RepID=UPI000FDA0C12|nr:hypothetical protein [Sinorhizobium medicae]RVJ23444.1 hypothetical protein CN179_24815 [Sinorhizobium medicae]
MNGLGKLVLLLSSDHDGEIVAAARALGRALKKMGKDWHWLAGLIDGDHEPPRQQRRRETVEDHQAAAEWLLKTVRQHLRENEIDFLETMQDWRGDPTPRQQAWLEKICRRWGYTP